MSTSRCCCGGSGLPACGECPCAANVYSARWTGSYDLIDANLCPACGSSNVHRAPNTTHSDGATRVLSPVGTGTCRDVQATYLKTLPQYTPAAFCSSSCSGPQNDQTQSTYTLLKPDQFTGPNNDINRCEWQAAVGLWSTPTVNCTASPFFGRNWNLLALFRKDFASCSAPGTLVFDRFVWRAISAAGQIAEQNYAPGDLVVRAVCNFGNSTAYANLYATAGTLQIL